MKMAPANLGMICTHNFTAILLIFAYFIEGLRRDALVASFLPLDRFDHSLSSQLQS